MTIKLSKLYIENYSGPIYIEKGQTRHEAIIELTKSIKNKYNNNLPEYDELLLDIYTLESKLKYTRNMKNWYMHELHCANKKIKKLES